MSLRRFGRAACCSLLLGACAAALPALAASGSLRGRVAVERGFLPEGSMLRATPLDAGVILTATIGADGTYTLPQVPEGAYVLEVIGPDGALLGGGTRTLVSPMALQVNLKLREVAARAPSGAAPAAPEPRSAEAAAAGEKRKEKGKAPVAPVSDAGGPGSVAGGIWPIAAETVLGVAVAIQNPEEGARGSATP